MPTYLLNIAEALAGGATLAEAEDAEGVTLTPEEARIALSLAAGE